MAEHNPTTTFLNPTLTKDWAPHRCGAAAASDWAVNTLTHLGGSGGWRVATPATYVGLDTADYPATWEGLAAAGWGYGAADFDIRATIANWTKATAGTASFVGLGVRRVNTPAPATPEGRIALFVGLEYTIHNPNWSWSFWVFDPYTGPNGQRVYVNRIDTGGNPTGADFRLVRSGTDILAYYDSGGGWQLIGTYDTTSWAGVGDIKFFQPWIGGSCYGGTLLDNASSFDIKAFESASGVVIPPADEGVDDDFEDGVVIPAPYYTVLGHFFGSVTNPVASEASGRFLFHNAGSNGGSGVMHTRTIYPGDFDLQFDLEHDTGIGNAIVLLMDVHSDDRWRYIAVSHGHDGGAQYNSLVHNVGAGQVTDVFENSGISTRHLYRVTRVGNVYTLYRNGSMRGSWTDTNGHFSGPLTIALAGDLQFSGGGNEARFYDVALLSGDDLLLVTPALSNPEFEDAAPGQGEAASWAQADTGPAILAPFMGSVVPIEQFEQGWGLGNQLGKSAFEDSDLIAATWDGGAEKERFDYSWRRPDIRGTLAVTAGHEALFTVGTWVRDKTSGGRAYVIDNATSGVVVFRYVDYHGEGNASKFAGATSHVLALLDQNGYWTTVPNGTSKQFGGTLDGSGAIHEGTLRLLVTIGGIEYILTDDGAGGFNDPQGLLDSAGANSINYSTRVLDVLFNTAPDASTIITALYDFGDEIAVTLTSPLAEAQAPPYNNSSSEEFVPSDLVQALFDATDALEAFEKAWGSNELSKNLFASAPGAEATDAALAYFALSNGLGGYYFSEENLADGFEELWKSNENSTDAFDTAPTPGAGTLSAALFTGPISYEDFEGSWSLVSYSA